MSEATEQAPLAVIHIQAGDSPSGSLILYTNRLALSEELVPLVFPTSGGQIPEGAYLDHWKGRFDTFLLVLNYPQRLLHLVHPTIGAEYLIRRTANTLAEQERVREANRRDIEEYAKWWRTYHPILGMSPRARAETPGWSEREGYFIWAGHDPHDYHASVQWERQSQYESVNAEVEYYLDRGLSLRDAINRAIAMGRVQIRAAALILAGFDKEGMQLLERQMMLDDAQLNRGITDELDADRAAAHAALEKIPIDD